MGNFDFFIIFFKNIFIIDLKFSVIDSVIYLFIYLFVCLFEYSRNRVSSIDVSSFFFFFFFSYEASNYARSFIHSVILGKDLVGR